MVGASERAVTIYAFAITARAKSIDVGLTH